MEHPRAQGKPRVPAVVVRLETLVHSETRDFTNPERATPGRDVGLTDRRVPKPTGIHDALPKCRHDRRSPIILGTSDRHAGNSDVNVQPDRIIRAADVSS